METKHTPGKWVANGSDTSLATWVDDDWDKERLIAQAPDLLAERDRLVAINAELVAALQNALNVMAGLVTGDLDTIKADSNAIKQARAALAKAK